MSIVSDNYPTIDAGRALIQAAGLRPTRVILRTEVWSGGAVDKGTVAITDVELLPRPKVVDKGGNASVEGGHFEISRITPPFAGGGWSAPQLLPAQPRGTITYMILVGPDGRSQECRIIDANIRKPFGYIVWVEDRR